MKNLQQFIFVFIIFNISLLATAQYDVSKISKKAIESYNKGLEKAQGAKYKEAIEALQDAIQKDVKYIDAYLSLAGVGRPVPAGIIELLFYNFAYRLIF